MSTIDTFTFRKLPLISLVCALFVIYPNIAWFSWEIGFLDPSEYTGYIGFFTFRFIFFWGVIGLLLRYNFGRLTTPLFQKRLLHNFLFMLVAYVVYVCISLITRKSDCLGSILLFQFFITCLLGTFIGHVSMLYSRERDSEQEIERLRFENMQSRCEALANQINPHFFFNALNGVSALVRRKNEEITLAYVNKLSDIFRYILQSDRKGLVPLGEELEFIEAFRYVMEVRFANKLVFTIDVDKDRKELKIPVLSLLPLMDNVVNHNIIDSDHRMEITISLNERMELVVSNPIYPKPSPADTNGTGLKNLESRFTLLMNTAVRIESDGKTFRVYLPLK